MNPLTDDPTDFTAYYRPDQRLEGERKLLWEILNEALRCLERESPGIGSKDREWHKRHAANDRKDARDWLLGEGVYQNNDYPFSSATICEYLGKDVEVLRRKLRQGEQLQGMRRSPHGQQKIKAGRR